MLKIDNHKVEMKCKNFSQILTKYAILGKTIYEQADESEKRVMKKNWNKALSPFNTTEDLAFMLEKVADEFLEGVGKLDDEEINKRSFYRRRY